MSHYKTAYLHTLYQLLVRSFFVYKHEFKDKIINGVIWSSITIGVFAYIMPSLGLDNFGLFILATMPASWGFFTVINNITALVADITSEGSRLQYELTLPIPQWLIFAKYGLENAYQSFIISLFVLPMGIFLLGGNIHNMQFCFIKFYLLQIISCLFFGSFSIFIASITRDIYTGIENIWLRIIFPIWYLGCFQFSFKTLYELSPIAAYINLLNPLTYVLEGSRAASLDPALSLPYWNCVIAIIIATIICSFLGIKILKKRLDCL